MTATAEYYAAIIDDKVRSAYDLGWEYRRRDRPMGDNPFEQRSQKWKWFREGWLEFSDEELQEHLIRTGVKCQAT